MLPRSTMHAKMRSVLSLLSHMLSCKVVRTPLDALGARMKFLIKSAAKPPAGEPSEVSKTRFGRMSLHKLIHYVLLRETVPLRVITPLPKLGRVRIRVRAEPKSGQNRYSAKFRRSEGSPAGGFAALQTDRPILQKPESSSVWPGSALT